MKVKSKRISRVSLFFGTKVWCFQHFFRFVDFVLHKKFDLLKWICVFIFRNFYYVLISNTFLFLIIIKLVSFEVFLLACFSRFSFLFLFSNQNLASSQAFVIKLFFLWKLWFLFHFFACPKTHSNWVGQLVPDQILIKDFPCLLESSNWRRLVHSLSTFLGAITPYRNRLLYFASFNSIFARWTMRMITAGPTHQGIPHQKNDLTTLFPIKCAQNWCGCFSYFTKKVEAKCFFKMIIKSVERRWFFLAFKSSVFCRKVFTSRGPDQSLRFCWNVQGSFISL